MEIPCVERDYTERSPPKEVRFFMLEVHKRKGISNSKYIKGSKREGNFKPTRIV